jgi:hypothetical protein
MKLMMTSFKCGPTKVGGIRGYEENYDNQPTLVPPCRPSCVFQWRIPISGDPISSFFCMLQELAIDQLILRFVVIHVSNSIFLSISLIMESDQILSEACSSWLE